MYFFSFFSSIHTHTTTPCQGPIQNTHIPTSSDVKERKKVIVVVVGLLVSYPLVHPPLSSWRSVSRSSLVLVLIQLWQLFLLHVFVPEHRAFQIPPSSHPVPCSTCSSLSLYQKRNTILYHRISLVNFVLQYERGSGCVYMCPNGVAHTIEDIHKKRKKENDKKKALNIDTLRLAFVDLTVGHTKYRTRAVRDLRR